LSVFLGFKINFQTVVAIAIAIAIAIVEAGVMFGA